MCEREIVCLVCVVILCVMTAIILISLLWLSYQMLHIVTPADIQNDVEKKLQEKWKREKAKK